MHPKDSSPPPGEQTGKRTYSSPKLEDLGSIAQFALGGAGSVMENMPGGPNMMKHP
jgi:hypothetical protein